MDDIVADFVAVCRPFEVAYKLPDNICRRAVCDSNKRKLRKEAVEEEGEEQEEGVAEQQPWKRFNFIFYSK